MERPTYLRRLLRQKILLIVGAVVAVVAGLLAGFTIVDGQIETRVVRSYTASATVLLSAPDPTYYQVEIPGSVQTLPPVDPAAPVQQTIQQAPVPIDLSNSAIILAYIASSDQVIDGVAAKVGGLEDGDSITAVRRTTQPAGDERFGGRLSLPVVDIVGVSTSPERAERLANEATTVFGDLVTKQQSDEGVPEDVRLVLNELNKPVADEGEGSNPAIPIVVVAVGVFLLFVALALIVEAVRERRRDGAESGDGDPEPEPEGESGGEQADPEGAHHAGRRAR